MNMLFIKHFVEDLWFLRYRECTYSGTICIRLLSPSIYIPVYLSRLCEPMGLKKHLYVYNLIVIHSF